MISQPEIFVKGFFQIFSRIFFFRAKEVEQGVSTGKRRGNDTAAVIADGERKLMIGKGMFFEQ